MPSASDKPDEGRKKEDQGTPEKQMLNILEHKMRNLDKRRIKLEGYKEALKEGKELNKDQQSAVEKFDEVTQLMDIFKDLHKQFSKVIEESGSKTSGLATPTSDPRSEIEKIRDVLKIQYILNKFGSDEVRADFTEGKNGAIVLNETQLTQLDEIFKHVSVTEEDARSPEAVVMQATNHYANLLQKKEAPFLNSSYAEVGTMINSIYQSDYFTLAAKKAADTYGLLADGTSAQPLDLTMAQHMGMDQSIDQSSSFFSAPGFALPQPRPITEVIGSGSFSFLQESQIDMESPHMDPAVVAAHPLKPMFPGEEAMPTQYINQPQPKTMAIESEIIKSHSPVAAPQTAQYATAVSGSPNMKIHAAPMQVTEFGQQIPTQTFTNQNFIKPFRGTSSSVYSQQMEQQNVAPVAPMIQSGSGLLDLTSSGQLDQSDKSKAPSHFMNVNAATFELTYKQATQAGLADASVLQAPPPQPLSRTTATTDWSQEDDTTTDFHQTSDDHGSGGDYSQSSSSFTFRGFRPPSSSSRGPSSRGPPPPRGSYRGAGGGYGSTNGYGGGRPAPGMGENKYRGPSSYNREGGPGRYGQKDDNGGYGSSSNFNGKGMTNGIGGPRGGANRGGGGLRGGSSRDGGGGNGGGMRGSPAPSAGRPPHRGGFAKPISSQS